MTPKKKSHLHRINHSNSTPLRLATGGMLATLVVGGGVAAAAQKHVLLDVNGEITETSTVTGDVRKVLDGAGVQVSDKDMVSPSLDSQVGNNQQITVRSARQVSLIVDGQERTIDTTALTVGDMLNQLGQTDPSASLSAARTSEIPLNGMSLEVTSPKFFTVNDGGQEGQMSLPARTVGDIFKMRGVPLGPKDVVNPPATTPLTAGMHVDVLRVQENEVTEDREVAPPVRVEEDPNAPIGQEKVLNPGTPGSERVVYTVRKENGAEVARNELRA
ncbi:ubiquitin-like domain-containing protein, partial [Corynebacterium heidelbergense]